VCENAAAYRFRLAAKKGRLSGYPTKQELADMTSQVLSWSSTLRAFDLWRPSRFRVIK